MPQTTIDRLRNELDQLNRDIGGAYMGDFDCHSISNDSLREMEQRRDRLEAEIATLVGTADA